jgi:hypothetical protein
MGKFMEELNGKEPVTEEEFTRAVIAVAVGGYGAGVFYIPELETAVKERKVDAPSVRIAAGKSGRVSVRGSATTTTTTTTTRTSVTVKKVARK